MEINKDVIEILKSHKIDKSQGLLCLLGIYYKLDIETTCNEATVKAINLTKIVEKDYTNNSLKWNIPLFMGQQTEWDWVIEYNDRWRLHQDKKESNRDVTTRMKKFFAKYPSYRKEDVLKATDAYFASVKNTTYLMKSTKFIFDGVGALEKSTLLGWCEKTASKEAATHQRGKVIS